MKKTITFLVLAALSFSAASQTRFGIKGGFDVIETKLNSRVIEVDNRLGYQIGGTLEFLVPASKFGGEVSVLYGCRKFDPKVLPQDTKLTDYQYITVPVHVKQRIGLVPGIVGLFVSAGPYAEAKLSGGDINSSVDEAVQIYKSKNFALGLSAAAGVNLFGHFDVSLQFRSELTDRYSKEYMDAGIFQDKKYQAWTASVSYFF